METTLSNYLKELELQQIEPDNLTPQYDRFILLVEQIVNLLIENKIEPHFINKLSYVPGFMREQMKLSSLIIQYYTLKRKKQHIVELLNDSYNRKHYLKILH